VKLSLHMLFVGEEVTITVVSQERGMAGGLLLNILYCMCSANVPPVPRPLGCRGPPGAFLPQVVITKKFDIVGVGTSATSCRKFRTRFQAEEWTPADTR
jgi:hypothetical protein